MSKHTGTLRVPGATLHYERSGSGPVLLLIPGGGADAGMYADAAETLAARHTVVSFDPRGMSRSPLDGPPADQTPADWADDALAVLDEVGAGPAGCAASSPTRPR